MPRKTEIEIMADNIEALDKRTRTSGNLPNLRVAQENHLTFSNPGDFFIHLLSTVNGRLYFWDSLLQSWVDPYVGG